LHKLALMNGGGAENEQQHNQMLTDAINAYQNVLDREPTNPENIDGLLNMAIAYAQKKHSGHSIDTHLHYAEASLLKALDLVSSSMTTTQIITKIVSAADEVAKHGLATAAAEVQRRMAIGMRQCMGIPGSPCYKQWCFMDMDISNDIIRYKQESRWERCCSSGLHGIYSRTAHGLVRWDIEPLDTGAPECVPGLWVATMYNAASMAYHLAGQDLEMAHQYMQMAIAIDPTEGAWHFNLAAMYKRRLLEFGTRTSAVGKQQQQVLASQAKEHEELAIKYIKEMADDADTPTNHDWLAGCEQRVENYIAGTLAQTMYHEDDSSVLAQRLCTNEYRRYTAWTSDSESDSTLEMFNAFVKNSPKNLVRWVPLMCITSLDRATDGSVIYSACPPIFGNSLAPDEAQVKTRPIPEKNPFHAKGWGVAGMPTRVTEIMGGQFPPMVNNEDSARGIA